MTLSVSERTELRELAESSRRWLDGNLSAGDLELDSDACMTVGEAQRVLAGMNAYRDVVATLEQALSEAREALRREHAINAVPSNVYHE